jgi:hypothetical protein
LRRILLFLVLSGLAIAGSGIDASAQGAGAPALSYDSNLSAVIARIQLGMEVNASTPAQYEAYLQDHTLVVVGGGIDLGERMLLETAKISNPWLGRSRQVDESPEALSEIGSGRYSLVILIGGPKQNNITSLAMEGGWLNESNTVEAGYVVEDGKTPQGAVILSISDPKGFQDDLVRQNVQYSPLRAVMPAEYVPLAATIISIGLLALINVAWNVISFKALDIGRKGRKLGDSRVMLGGVNIAEILALTAASIVLGISMSWQYFGPGKDFLGWLAIDSAVCLFAALTHEIAHISMARLFRIKVEYRFWPAGSILTLLSSYLGNTFSVQGFLLEEIPQGVEKWKVGLMKLAAPMLSCAIMIAFALLNLARPDPIYKIVYSISGVWAMAEILPFGSLDGKDIKEWSRDAWYLSFFLIGASYFIVNFLI